MIVLEQPVACDAATLWKYLTDSRLVPRWMSDTPGFSIHSEWRQDAAIRIETLVNGTLHINEGVITRFDPEKVLSYAYVNSVSLAHYRSEALDKVEFVLEPLPEGTLLRITCSTGYGEVEEKHLRLYWTVTLAVLKSIVESEIPE